MHILGNPRRACSQASVGVNRKIKEGLKFSIQGFFGGRKIWQVIFISWFKEGSHVVLQLKQKRKIARYIVSQIKYAPQSVLVCFQRGFISFRWFLLQRCPFAVFSDLRLGISAWNCFVWLCGRGGGGMRVAWTCQIVRMKRKWNARENMSVWSRKRADNLGDWNSLGGGG